MLLALSREKQCPLDQSVGLTVPLHVVQGSISLAEYVVVLLLPMISRALYGHSIVGLSSLTSLRFLLLGVGCLRGGYSIVGGGGGIILGVW